MKKIPQHIVIIARHYPPLISGGGRRVFLLVKGLRELGIRVSVVAPILPKHEDGISVEHPHPEPDLKSLKKKGRLRDFLRTWLLYPDNDVNWSRRAGLAAARVWPNNVDWVITTSPPESVHVTGQYLKSRLNCQWHADIRDYWLEHPLVEIRRNPLRKWIEARIARRLLSRADTITAISNGMKNEAVKLSRKPVEVLENFAEEPPVRQQNFFKGHPDGTIHIVYTGAFEISDPKRTLKPLLDSFRQAISQNSKLFLHILGPLYAHEAEQMQEPEFREFCHYYGKVPRETARNYQVNADALLITAAPGTVIIPGKLVEYQTTGLPIIAIGSGPWMNGLSSKLSPAEQMSNLQFGQVAYAPSDIVGTDQSVRALLTLMINSKPTH